MFITVTDQLYVASLGGELTLHDLDSLQPIRTFGGSRGFITQVEGTADGTLIATNGGDHNVIVYDVASGVRIGTPITVADDESNRIALSLDGTLAVRRRRGRRRLARHARSGTSTRSTGRPPHAASPAATSHAKSGPPTSAHWRHIGRRAPTCRLTADRRLQRRWLATPEPNLDNVK